MYAYEQVVVLMGSPSDASHCEKIRDHCLKLGVPCQLRVTSAHKGTQETLAIIAQVGTVLYCAWCW